MKLEELLADIKSGNTFGPVSAVLHKVEFQKRGLPHAHIIIWLGQDTSQPNPSFIDKFISAEIPGPCTDPLGYALVAEHMMHGPCGPAHQSCPCMKKERMPVHHPDDNCIVYDTNTDIASVASEEFLRRTMLTEWFVANQNDRSGRDLIYCEFPSKWRWETSSRSWERRRRGTGKIGRIYYVHPSADWRAMPVACLATIKSGTMLLMRLLPGQHPHSLENFFVTMILFCEVSDEYAFFEKVWKLLADDIQYRFRDSLGNTEYQISDTDLKNYLHDDLSSLFSKHGVRMRDHDLPQRTDRSECASGNRLIEEELSYDVDRLMSEATELVARPNQQQLSAFRVITETVVDGAPGFFFVSGYGGTGKTFLWGAIVAWLRAHKKIVPTVASSGVASLLLSGGRTAHSRFKIPCDLDDSSVCDIKRSSMLGELIESASLVIWDEALDRTFRDLLSRQTEGAGSLVFGGKVVVLGGDLRQILPVVEGGGRAQCAPMAFATLPSLCPGDWRATIRVRVCHKWEYHGGTDDGSIQHMDLVLVDEQGNSMYGEIPTQEVEAKSPLIEEGGIFVISRFRVSNAKLGYRAVDARYMVEFTLHTTVVAARDDMPDFPRYAYKITTYRCTYLPCW
ncbi:unnamed protein product [Miscanthus lutarioriparius]|uniref:ATP-dependent DNA helicase n=1 Tax=Miscanthus lutarioriparius TaxID=422564 RepID=A0A811PR19_9POAL|nr:unnamed protein product [Miscanthus lutarioriparius]